MPKPTLRPYPNLYPYNHADWKGQFIDVDHEVYTLARLECGASYRIFQLRDGKVIITVDAQQLRPGGPSAYIVGEPMTYGDALRTLATESDNL